MAICITFGSHEFTSMLEGYEHVRAYCYNCQHWNGHCVTRWPWFTICFIPAIPLAFHKYKVLPHLSPPLGSILTAQQEVTCYTCRFTQDLRDRPDITPETRPPPGVPAGPAPPPQAYYPPQGGAPPPQGYGYK
ncbi:hypothetical protein P170DRAFT_511359 [Aspergillus steynii IBT 23096]|uniref:Uncharacterized protein n=1 Tax=Aspergillus steynii IBT 23096 TaxID=1392250 RepID=A0A2I2G1B6_9EURO|nr:uncharacterized protein P170DRAFT_511359 [Aspergillus steynii IBT 23096]PLB46664.1 hypothetical protein P170DRAFT_511359 [Aspergillus steynii IBT 23096]